MDSVARQPGIDSSLSSVPPVCPSPRPDSCGTATPQAATSGASGRVILSPTPPVECLSAVGAAERGEVQPLAGGDHRRGPAGELAPGHAAAAGSPSRARTSARRRRRRACRRRSPSRSARRSARAPSRLAMITSTASKSRVRSPSTASRSSRAEGLAAAPRSSAYAVRGVDQQVGAAVLPQQLAAAAARHQHVAVGRRRRRSATSRPPPVRVQRRHQPALGAQRHAVRRVLDVAADDDPAVVDERGGATGKCEYGA